MNRWLRRIRGALGLGLLWAVPWAVVGLLVGLLVDPDGAMDEMWWAAGAYPGFIGSVFFSVALAIAERRRQLNDLSLSRVGLWGALAGLMIGILPFTFGTYSGALPLLTFAGIVVGSTTLLSAVSATGSLALARRAQARELSDATSSEPAVEVAHEEHELLDR